MPTNLYGSYNNFDLRTAHVFSDMIRNFNDAKQNGNSLVNLWGSGSLMREFLYVEDLADAVRFSLQNKLGDNLYSVGTGKNWTIKELALLVQNTTGHQGEILWDASKPDGTPCKLMDVSKLTNQGWTYSVELEDGIQKIYDWFLTKRDKFKEVKI